MSLSLPAIAHAPRPGRGRLFSAHMMISRTAPDGLITREENTLSLTKPGRRTIRTLSEWIARAPGHGSADPTQHFQAGSRV